MTEVSKLSAEQEIRALALNLAAALRRPDVRLTAGNRPDGLAEQTVRDADMFAEFIDIGVVPQPPASDLSVAEEYAVWLAETGVDESASNDMNEGADPVSERGEEVSDEDWGAAMALAHKIAEWIRTNPGTVLQLTREGIRESETAR